MASEAGDVVPSTPISGAIPAPQPSVASIVQPPAAPTDAASRFRGASVEDLQLSPAVCVDLRTPLGSALRIAHDHDYSQLPVMDGRKPKGYLDVKEAVHRTGTGKLSAERNVSEAMTRFRGESAGGTFTVITPDTGLAELEAFLDSNPFAFVTDVDRQFVIGIATSEDLSRYIARRGLTPAPSRGAGDKSNADASMDVDGNQTPTGDQTSTREGDTVSVKGAQASASQEQPLSRRAEEERRKDRTLGEFLGMLDGYDPLIPDEVTEHYLSKVGFECDDQRLKRLLSLAAEKFVSDIATDAFQYARIRTNAGPGRQRAGASGARDRARTVLTMDDLSAALGEYGINAGRSFYH
ncbi:transcription initiation factor subunit taf10 [Ceraceosorus bombacis]|uniref:Transcription initiation factor subunit taf10 n=1 Tax=Ceraceosorus bombacis TaxID=401625 RepID=A0A0P1BIH3_9BASI|nr:transcription initiation factor subunit taf10 [Ceraceosorus bombacis]